MNRTNIALAANQRFDNYVAPDRRRYDPATTILDAAARLVRVDRLLIPRRVWGAIKQHPGTMIRYQTLPVFGSGILPALDSQVFERMLEASWDGPIVPGALGLTDSDANEVHLIRFDPCTSAMVALTDVLDRTDTARYGEWGATSS